MGSLGSGCTGGLRERTGPAARRATDCPAACGSTRACARRAGSARGDAGNAKDARDAGDAVEAGAAVRALRPGRSPASVVAALVLAGAGALAMVESFMVVADRAPRLVSFARTTMWAQSTAWSDPAALAVAGTVTVLGALLLLAAVLPGRPRLVPLRTGDPDLVFGVSRPTLAALIASEVSRVEGVRRVRVRVRRRRLVVVATALGDTAGTCDAAGLARRVREATGRELARLNPLIAFTVRPRVRVRPGGRT
ncbi:DUF6286 domain-containing protein [Thermopolyspora sp. NPDC052614]|uniref:DUF6286 domain-containing protein n=1 Tax=Thermopolyspora sp. NPDC052614 TaxID=3155682 RepID=UPI0034141D62